MLDAAARVIMVAQWVDALVFMIAGILLIREKRKSKSTDYWVEQGSNRLVFAFAIAMLLWPVLIVLCAIFDLLQREWFDAALDVLLLVWLWWMFFGRNNWKKWKKRAKEKVAVIKGRLKIVPIPAPHPA